MRSLFLPLPLLALAALALAACAAPDPTPTLTVTPKSAAHLPTPTPTSAPAPTSTAAATPSRAPAATPTLSPSLALAATPTPTGAPAATPPPPGAERNAYGVRADPNYEEELLEAGISTRVWKTDFRFHTVPYDEIFSGGVPRDGIPPLYDPKAVSIAEADEWVEDVEPVVALELNGEARAYPLQVLTLHEIANDNLGGVPVAVTFCPLCNSAVVFDRTLDGAVYEFGVSGNLRNSDLVMWDRQTESWWQQLTGDALAGALAGAQLDFIPAQIVSWNAFKSAHPDGDALSKDTGYARDYGRNPYVGYDRADNPPFLFFEPGSRTRAETDPRLLPKERVAALEINGDAVAFPYSVLQRERVVSHEVGGEEVVVFYELGVVSALGAGRIAEADDVGATGVFRPVADDRRLTFRLEGGPETGAIVDNETGSEWSILGAATAGPLAVTQLERVAAYDHFWFAWAAFKPQTRLYASP